MTRLPAGSPCTDRAQCAYGAFCNDICLVSASLGEACDASHICGNGLECSSGSGSCVKAGGVGAACTSTAACDIGALIGCNDSTGKCEEFVFAEPGDGCPVFDGAPVVCTKGSSCISADGGTTGSCVAPAKVGESCSSEKRCESFINCRQGKCVLPTYEPCL